MLLAALVAGSLTIAVFLPAERGGFVWDDGGLITKNLASLDEWSDVVTAFGRPATAGEGVAYYRPILIASFVVDARAFGTEAPVFHRTNVVLHGINVALVLCLLVAYGASLWGATLGALLFGLHPLQSQAVALILGRNDVLLVPPIVGMLVADEVVRRRGWPRLADALIVVAFALTLWTKETGIVAPVFLVLLDVFWRGRSLREVRARLPLFAVLAVVAALYFVARMSVLGALLDTGRYGYTAPLARLPLAAAIFGYYVRHVALPWGSAPAPYHAGLVDPARPELWIAVAWTAAYLIVTALAARRAPRVAAGLLFFGVALVPVLALAAPMKVLILDHRTYLPLVGVALAASMVRRLAAERVGRVAALLVLAVLASLTFRRLPSYADALSLWALGVEAAPSSEYARNNYAAALMDADRTADAVVHLREALRLNPDYYRARFNLAACLEYLGDRPQAIRELEIIVQDHPDEFAVVNRLGLMRNRAGDLPGAQAAFEQAAKLRPDEPVVLRNLADALERRNLFAASVTPRRHLTEVEPRNPQYWSNLGRALANADRPADAIPAYEQALALGMDTGAVRSDLARALWNAGRATDAATHARKARDLGVTDPELMQKLGALGLVD